MIFYWRDEDKLSWEVLSGVLLCITGVEAMYADLGHFSRQAVQVSLNSCFTQFPDILSCMLFPD